MILLVVTTDVFRAAAFVTPVWVRPRVRVDRGREFYYHGQDN
jgi:hypothetical protein